MANAKCFLSATDAEKTLVQSRKRVREEMKTNDAMQESLKVKKRKLEKEDSSISVRLDEMMQTRLGSEIKIKSKIIKTFCV